MSTKAYVASTSTSSVYALDVGRVIAACAIGPDPEGDAESYAKDYAEMNDVRTYVYQVEIKPLRGFKVQKEVVPFVIAQ